MLKLPLKFNKGFFSFCTQIGDKLHFIILLAAVLIIILSIVVICPLSANKIDSEHNAIFENKWMYGVDGEVFKPIELPHGEKRSIKSHITLKNVIPKQTIKGATVLLRTSQQYAKVFVGGERIYDSHENGGVPQYPASAFHFVRLPTDCSGKEIIVILDSPYKRYAGITNQIFIGSKASNIFHTIHENGFNFAVGFIVCVLGIILMLVFLFTKKQSYTVGVVYLGGFFAAAGFWVIDESRLGQYLFSHSMVSTVISIFGMTLLPIFFGLYCYYSHLKGFKRLLKCLIAFMSLVSITIGVISVLRPMMTIELLPYELILTGIFAIIISLLIIFEAIKYHKNLSFAGFGMVVLVVGSIIELVIYLLSSTSYNNSIFLTMGLLLFGILMVFDIAHNIAKIYRDSVKIDALTVLAYTDSLTGFKNHTAFIEEMSYINLDKSEFVSIIMFDVNNLKVVNDTKGHLAGDIIIRNTAQVIKEAVCDKDKLYRIGGDEFVAIISHDAKFNEIKFEKLMMSAISRFNSRSVSNELSIAFGCATYSKYTDKDIFETFSRADANMYKYKSKQKSLV